MKPNELYMYYFQHLTYVFWGELEDFYYIPNYGIAASSQC